MLYCNFPCMNKVFLPLVALLFIGAGCLKTPVSNTPNPQTEENLSNQTYEEPPLPEQPRSMTLEQSQFINDLLINIVTTTKLPFYPTQDQSFDWGGKPLSGISIQVKNVREDAARQVEGALTENGFTADYRGNADGTFVGSTGWINGVYVCRVSTQLKVINDNDGIPKSDDTGQVIISGSDVQVTCGVME